MNEIQVFNNPEFGNVRTVERDGEVWFVGRDVATALGCAKPDGAIQAHCRCPLKWGIPHPQSKDKTIEVTIISEGDMYRLISRSTLKSAEKFEAWVFDEVLPSIRKTGSYQLPQTTDGKIQLLAQGQVEISQRVEKIENTVSKMKDELPLFPIELEVIVKSVKKRGMDIVGGKENPAYSMAYRKVVSDIYSELHRNFNVDSYKNIRRHDLARVRDVVAQYRPPMFLADMIAECNAEVLL